MAARDKQPPGKRPRGRPSKWEDRFVQEAFRLAMLGLTNEQMAEFFEIGTTTFERWVRSKPEFSDALKKGRLPADGQVAVSLYKRATGYSHPDVDIRVVNGRVVQTPITRHYPPDTLAAIYWLKNRQRDRWYDMKPREYKPDGADVVDEADALTAAARAIEALDEVQPPENPPDTDLALLDPPDVPGVVADA